jgi:hypothetical protein
LTEWASIAFVLMVIYFSMRQLIRELLLGSAFTLFPAGYGTWLAAFNMVIAVAMGVFFIGGSRGRYRVTPGGIDWRVFGRVRRVANWQDVAEYRIFRNRLSLRVRRGGIIKIYAPRGFFSAHEAFVKSCLDKAFPNSQAQ